MRKSSLAAYAPLVAAVGGVLWSVGFIATGAIVVRDRTGYDQWDILWYLGVSTLGFAFFAIGALTALIVLVACRNSGNRAPTTLLWVGLLLNVVFAAALFYFLKNA